MRRGFGYLAAVLLVCAPVRAGELDSEFGSSTPGKTTSAAPTDLVAADQLRPAKDLVAIASASELDAETPVQAFHHGGFGGFHHGGFGGWGHGGWGWGHRGWGGGYGGWGWGRGFGYPGWGYGGFGYGLGYGLGLGYGGYGLGYGGYGLGYGGFGMGYLPVAYYRPYYGYGFGRWCW